MPDLFGTVTNPQPIHVNIFADEVQGKLCPYSKQKWDYIGIVVEDLSYSLLDTIVTERFLGNFDKESKYYEKNNKQVHWCEIRTADTKNICKRWLEFIISPNKSKNHFYSYILGINISLLNKDEFNTEGEFNSIYNRFFRSAISYSLKTFFSGSQIIVENIFHEEGQQQHYEYFPWHSIFSLSQEENIQFNCEEITFLPKDHKTNPQSNLIQLCDTVLGVSTSILHGIIKGKKSKYREELADLYLPLFTRLIDSPKNKNSKYEYYNRIMISFFPKDQTKIDDFRRQMNQFYTTRPLYYLEEKSGQLRLDL